MDRITKSLLEDFSRQYELTDADEDKQFEAFATYLSLSRNYSESIEPASITTGDGGDTGIDGIAILVNGALVNDEDEVRELAEISGFLDVDFIFVQAERSPSFNAGKIGTFGFGVADFFAQKPRLARNDAITNAASIMETAYSFSGKFRRRPSCRLYYVTTGTWAAEPELVARIDALAQDLRAMEQFDEIRFSPIGANDIQRLYTQTKNSISREITFADRVTIPEIPGVSEAYLGIIPATAFLSLIEDDDGELIRSIFYDNVRDFQGYNPVNSEIKDTLLSSDLKSRFVLMNNGITVIAKTMRVTGNRLSLEDYQIVNGCQTSHVLQLQKDSLDSSVMVPLRVIATTDDDVVGAIIKATNRQTSVGEEQLLALSEMQKRLERFFAAFEVPKRLYYERRSRQYNSDATIEKTRVVTLGNLIRTFAAMFLEEPHRATRNFKALLDQVGTTIFAEQDRLEPYYVSAYALYRLEFLFRNQTLEAKYKPARYQLLLCFRLLLPLGALPRMNSHEMGRVCERILHVLYDPDESARVFRRAVKVVAEVANGNLDRDHIRTQPFTEALKARCAAGQFDPEILE
jgi:hypothetical protein